VCFFNHSSGTTLCRENINCPKHEPLHAQNDEINGNIEFSQWYPVIAADALLEVDGAVISAVLSLGDHLSLIIHFAGTIFSRMSAAIALLYL
jgi:hypothetical protein